MLEEINNKLLKTINYSEFIVFCVICVLVISSTPLFSLLSVIFVGILLLSLLLSYVDFSNADDSWVGFLSMFFSGLILSLLYSDMLIAFSILITIIYRLTKSAKNSRMKLLLSFLLATLLGFIVHIFANDELIAAYKSLHISTTQINITAALLLFTMLLYVFFEFVKVRTVSRNMLEDAHNSRERLKKMVRVSNSFSRFVPDQLREPIIQSAVSTKVFNKRANLTVFFSDIAGFTRLSDNLDADSLAEILNTYMERMTIVAKKHDAVLDKFIGDGMMCFFGAHGEKTDKEYALDCVAMAIDMKREMRELRRVWRERGFDGLYIRMGINTGYCHVGNFGSENRMSYTVIGKEVNLAARLESVAKPDQIVISKSTYEYVSHLYQCHGYGEFALKGFESKVLCWVVCDTESSPIRARGNTGLGKNLPGFDLHLDFQEVKNYDYKKIRNHLLDVIEKLEVAEKMDSHRNK